MASRISLTLADGSTWHVIGTESSTSAAVTRLQRLMGMDNACFPDGDTPEFTVGSIHLIDDRLELGQFSSPGRRAREFHRSQGRRYPPFPVSQSAHLTRGLETDENAIWVRRTEEHFLSEGWQNRQVSFLICARTVWKGGLPFHGALAEAGGRAVILAGHSGVGKTTASQRLPAPWKSLSDDTTLLVRNGNGGYQAHPWPSAAEFSGVPGARVDVRHSVPLKGIFYLEQAETDAVAPLGKGRAVCRILESASQTLMVNAMDGPVDGVVRSFRSQVFENICEIVERIPVYQLELRLSGRFWEEIETVLNER